MALFAALLLSLLAAPVRAQPIAALVAPAQDLSCRMLGSLGCYYIPDSVRAKKGGRLLIYLRGWLPPFDGHVPEASRAESARQAFTRYDLRRVADEGHAALLVTASSDLPVSAADVQALEAQTGLTFRSFVIASHSGGCASLSPTLPAFPRLERLILLDTFYFGEPLARIIGASMSAGAACSGFFTTYKSGAKKEGNDLRYTRDILPFLPQPCAVENHDDYGHNDGVNACLGAYVAGRVCPPKTP